MCHVRQVAESVAHARSQASVSSLSHVVIKREGGKIRAASLINDAKVSKSSRNISPRPVGSCCIAFASIDGKGNCGNDSPYRFLGHGQLIRRGEKQEAAEKTTAREGGPSVWSGIIICARLFPLGGEEMARDE